MNPANAVRAVRRFLQKRGYDLVRYEPNTHALARRARLLRAYDVNVVLDVGANIGQYGLQLRDMGYTGRIVSFEPVGAAYRQLTEVARADGSWTAINCALGDFDGRTDIHVAGNSQSSSVFPMLPAHVQSEPASQYVASEAIEVRRLDSCFQDLCSESDRVLLKIDTQGFEKRVLEGAETSLLAIPTIQLELSLVPLYDGEALFDEMYRLVQSKGFHIVSIETSFADKHTGQLLQFDGILHRSQ
jgi:FkbM family methyltransferase